jgi:hypothetical protein
MNSKYAGVGISLGLCFGAALGAALHNLGVGIDLGVNVGVGIALGVSLGTVASSRFVFGGRSDAALARKWVSEKPLPHPLGL